jgi:hypothetical protein
MRTGASAAAMVELVLRLILPNGGVRCAHRHPTCMIAMLCGLQYDADNRLVPLEGTAA